MKRRSSAIILGIALLSASAATQADDTEDSVTWLDPNDSAHSETLQWNALIPQDWRPGEIANDATIAALRDDDPRAKQLLDELKARWRQAPVVEALDGKAVRLPGFVVPLEMDAEQIEQFLLVPYYGACIHVPPPPSNQTVHVITRRGNAYRGQLFDSVWVSGTLRVEHHSSELGDAGYRLENASVAPYQ